jgi:hypothetical protein
MLYLNLTEGKTQITTKKNMKKVKPRTMFRVLLDLLDTGLNGNELEVLSYMMAEPERVWTLANGGDDYFMEILECKRSTVVNIKNLLIDEGIVDVSENKREFWLSEKWKMLATGILKRGSVEFGMCFDFSEQ